MHLRFTNLKVNANYKISIRKLRAEHLGKLIALEGLVRKATQVKPKILDAAFQCVRCMAIIREPQDNSNFKEPLECYKDQGGCGKAASSTRFALLTEESKPKGDGTAAKSIFVDTQKLETQEIPEGLRGGEQPEKIVGYVEDDICKLANPGDKVTLNGILRSRRKGHGPNQSVTFETFLQIISVETEQHDYDEVELTSEDEIEILKISKDPDLMVKLRSSIAPTVYGMDIEKEALTLQMFGGVTKQLPDGNRLRGDIHILLIGDPGVAKSQLLRHISDVAPRGIYASGKSSSGAGLTAAAVRDPEFGEGRWTLEAGALVLADKGICCIDELNLMDEKDRCALNEAMEQQRITVSKAGINATLQCRCAILAAANPKGGRWDRYAYIYDQLDLMPTLLSRFDAIFPLIDNPNEEGDYNLAEHILEVHTVGEMAHNQRTTTPVKPQAIEIKKLVDITPPLSGALVRKYVAYSRMHCFPVLTKDCKDMLRRYYVSIRNTNKDENANGVSMTPRQMEALIRMSEASARSRLSNDVMVEDAERAKKILEHYLKMVASEGGHIDVDAIMTGQTKSQKDRIETIKGILKERGEMNEEELLQECVHLGMNVEKLTKDISRLKDNGTIYCPTNKSVKLLKGL